MEWYEWIATGATGGVYAVGKTLYEASQAAGQAGADIEQVASEAAAALDKLFRSLDTFAAEIAQSGKNLNELFKIERLDGRTDNELLPAELKRKNVLTKKREELKHDVADYQKRLVDLMLQLAQAAVQGDVTRQKQVEDEIAKITEDVAMLALIEREIADIVYQEPGSIPKTADFVAQAVERFDTLEQPRIEDIMDSANNNLVETQGLVQDLRKLLWLRESRTKSSLTELEKVNETSYRRRAEYYGVLAERSNQLNQQLIHSISQMNSPVAVEIGLPLVAFNERQETNNLAASHFPSAESMGASKNLVPDEPSDGNGLSGKSNSTALSRILSQQNFIQAQQRYYAAEQRKAETTIALMNSQQVEIPGVLTLAIDELRKGIARFNQTEQPRLEQLIESLDQTVQESKKTMQETKATIAQVRTFLRLMQAMVANRWVKIGAIVIVGLFGLIMLFGMIALFRIAFQI